MTVARATLERTILELHENHPHLFRFQRVFAVAAFVCLCAFARAAEPATAPASKPVPTVRVAAIGGITDFGFWKELSARFEKETGIHIETVATGNKDAIPAIFKKGGIDLVTMQSADAVMGLVADGYAMEPRPWVELDLILVGPANDPAGIKGMTDAAAAVKKIIQSKSTLVVHGNGDADTIVRGILQADQGEPDSAKVIVLLDDHQKRVLQAAADQKAYTLIARGPFKSGKIPAEGLAAMVEGDPLLRRPIIAAVADPARVTGAHPFEARRLLQFLRSADTQEWIAGFGRGTLDDRSAFFAVSDVGDPAKPGAGGLSVIDAAGRTTALDLAALAKLPRHQVHVKVHSGKEAVYDGVFVRDLLNQAGVPLGDHQMRGPNLSLYLTVIAADGYRAVFAMPELDDDFAERSILLADHREGQPLEAGEGPFRLIAPQEARQARWVRRVTTLQVDRVAD